MTSMDADVAPEILQPSNERRHTKAVDIWSLGVVLYICLCGFPPFSDELTTEDLPYTLPQQIKMGQFDYPDPYWTSVDDLALDLIDKMLPVDHEKRVTANECLEHPWILERYDGGCIGAAGSPKLLKRGVECKRTIDVLRDDLNKPAEERCSRFKTHNKTKVGN